MRRFLAETRDEVLATLWAQADANDPVVVARLQQEARTLTFLVGDVEAYGSLKDALIEEAIQFAEERSLAEAEDAG